MFRGGWFTERSLRGELKRKRWISPSLKAHGVLYAAGFLAAAGLGPYLGCSVSISPGVGVTSGGVKDIAEARAEIENGGIPDPEAVTVEGFFSEHDIGIEAPPTPPLLYNTAAVAWNQDFDEIAPLATIAVGFGTHIDPETFTRRPQNLCLVIDRSASMDEAIEEGGRTSKFEAVQIAVDRLLGRLASNDRVSIVTFNEGTRIVLEPVPGTSVIEIKSALDEIVIGGGTNLAAGLARGFNLLKNNRSAARADRLLVFTDADPTVGKTSAEELVGVMKSFAKDDLGATIFGVGVNFNEEVAYEISRIRGGNFVFLSDFDRIVSVFDKDFDYLVTPIAYDVAVIASIPFALDVADVHGADLTDRPTHTVELTIPTLFLSSRQGGGVVMIRVRPGSLVSFEEGFDVATVRLSFQDSNGATVTSTETLSLPAGLDPDAAESYFPNEGAQRAVLLLNTALVLQRSLEDAYPRSGYYHYDYPDTQDLLRAADRIRDYLPYFDALAEGLPDRSAETSRSLSQERALLDKLLANIMAEVE